MKITLDNYSTDSVLGSYEFVFAQYLGGELSGPEFAEQVPTVYIFGEVCKEMRKIYLSRPDSDLSKLEVVEKEILAKLSALMSMPPDKLNEIYEKYMARAKDMFSSIGKNPPPSN